MAVTSFIVHCWTSGCISGQTGPFACGLESRDSTMVRQACERGQGARGPQSLPQGWLAQYLQGGGLRGSRSAASRGEAIPPASGQCTSRLLARGRWPPGGLTAREQLRAPGLTASSLGFEDTGFRNCFRGAWWRCSSASILCGCMRCHPEDGL